MSETESTNEEAVAAEGAEVEEEGVDVPLARLTDRFLAYVIDALLFFLPARLTLGMASNVLPVPKEAELRWHMMWLGAYLFYQAVFNSGGRTTLGKKLLGLHIVDLEGEPLNFGKALLRAVAYIPSGACAELGFFWAFAHPMHRGWHDLFAGTVVVQTEERPMAFRAIASVLSVALFLALSGLTVRSMILKQTPAVQAAHAKLAWVASLEEWHKSAKGHYTENIEELAAAGGGGAGFKASLFDGIRPDGFGILVLDKDAGFVLTAKALDGNEVVYRSPKK